MELLVSILPFVAIFAVFYLLVIRPANKRRNDLAEVQRSLAVNDEVITSSGFFGTIRSFDGDKVGLEVAEGVVIKVARGAVVGHPDGAAGYTSEERYEEPTDPTADPDTEPVNDPTATDRTATDPTADGATDDVNRDQGR